MVLGTEIDVQQTGLPSSGAPVAGSPSSGGNSTYSNTPAIALSQPSSMSIAMAAVSIAFPSKTVTYDARTLTIPDPGSTPTWYYVTVADPSFYGDGSPLLAAYAETTTEKVGATGYTYIGAIQCTHAAGSSATPLAGGWPAPQGFLVRP